MLKLTLVTSNKPTNILDDNGTQIRVFFLLCGGHGMGLLRMIDLTTISI